MRSSLCTWLVCAGLATSAPAQSKPTQPTKALRSAVLDLHSAKSGVRRRAARACAKAGKPAIRALVATIRTGPERARAAAALALRGIPDAASDAALRRLAGDVRAPGRASHWAAWALRPSATSALREVVRVLASPRGGYEQEHILAVVGARALPFLIPLLDSRTERHRQAALRTLLCMGSVAAPAMPKLANLLACANPLTASKACTALLRLGWAARSELRRVALDVRFPARARQRAVSVLERLGDEATLVQLSLRGPCVNLALTALERVRDARAHEQRRH